MKNFITPEFYTDEELLIGVMNTVLNNPDMVEDYEMYESGEFLTFTAHQELAKEFLKNIVTDFDAFRELQLKTTGLDKENVFDFTPLVLEYQRTFHNEIYFDNNDIAFYTL